MKCDKCGYDDKGTGDWAHVCGPVEVKTYENLKEFNLDKEHMTNDESHLPVSEQSLIFRLRKRAEIRRQIVGRKSVEEGKPDKIADLLEEAADKIEQLMG
jgi:uncharacterized protein YcaQ